MLNEQEITPPFSPKFTENSLRARLPETRSRYAEPEA